ncbi:ribonuclease H-like domain-containing protein, partial [Tanacetum coccineum]
SCKQAANNSFKCSNDKRKASLVKDGSGLYSTIETAVTAFNGFKKKVLQQPILMTTAYCVSSPSQSRSYENVEKCKVCNSLYGLKQAPRDWNAKLTTALAEHGFKQSKFNYSSYIKLNGANFVVLPHMHSPLQSHMNVALRVWRYLKGLLGLGIQFDKRLRVSSDADWAKCPKTRKFVTGLADNHVFHEKLKHFEIDVHLVREKFSAGIIKLLKFILICKLQRFSLNVLELNNFKKISCLKTWNAALIVFNKVRKVFAKDTKVLKMYRWMVLLIEWMANKLWKDSQLWGKLRKLGLFDMFAGRSSRKATSEECHTFSLKEGVQDVKSN